jgi:hypothetical protein
LEYLAGMELTDKDLMGAIVYALRCPETNAIRYIGGTHYGIRRHHDHTKRVYKNPKTRVAKWTSALVADGTPPIFDIVCRLDGPGMMFCGDNETLRLAYSESMAMRMLERCLISRLKRLGFFLLNDTNHRVF